MSKKLITEKQQIEEDVSKLMKSTDFKANKLGFELAETLLGFDKFTFYSEFHEDYPKWMNLCTLGIYAHGKLEKAIGFDILTIPFIGMKDNHFELPFEKGIHAITVKDNNNIYKANLYYWRMNNFTYRRHRGLVVLPDDIEAVEYAKLNYKNSESSL